MPDTQSPGKSGKDHTGTRSRYVLWAPLAVFLITFIINLAVNYTGADDRRYGDTGPDPLFVFMFIYSFVLYYYLVYCILTLFEKLFKDEYRGASGDFRVFKSLLSVIINLMIYAAFLAMPSTSSGMITLPMTMIWGSPGLMFEYGMRSCARNLAGNAAGLSHHPERETWDELRAKGYRMGVDYAVFNHGGGAVVRFDVTHPVHDEIRAGRFFRFDFAGTPDRSFSPPSGRPEYEEVLSLPGDRFLYYPRYGSSVSGTAILSANGKNLDVTINGIIALKVPWAVDGNTIFGIDGTTIVKVRLPGAVRKGLHLEAERFIDMEDVKLQGHHLRGFTFRPSPDGRILCALDMASDDPTKPRMALLASFTPWGRLLSKQPVSGEFVHGFEYGACVDPDGGLLYVGLPGAGEVISRIRPDGSADRAFNDRFISTCGYFYRIANVAADREGRILVSGRALPDNKPTVLLADRGGRKIATIYCE